MRKNSSLRLRHHSTVESIEPRCLMTGQTGDFHLDYTIEEQFHPESAPTTLAVNDLTGLTGARSNYGLTGLGQTVVVIDSGIAWDHSALGGGLGGGYRVVGGW
jgi:hypothetical protein